MRSKSKTPFTTSVTTPEQPAASFELKALCTERVDTLAAKDNALRESGGLRQDVLRVKVGRVDLGLMESAVLPRIHIDLAICQPAITWEVSIKKGTPAA